MVIKLFLILPLLLLCWKTFSQTEPRLVLPVGHTGGITSVNFSTDNNLILTTSSDNTARIWDMATGKELQVLIGHSESIATGNFNSNNKLVVTAGDSTARIWDVNSGELLHVLKVTGTSMRSAKFSSDNKYILTHDDSSGRIWDAANGNELVVLKGHLQEINTVEFSYNEKLVLTSSMDSTARLWDIATGTEKLVLKNHSSWLNSALFSFDDKFIVTTSDRFAYIWEVQSGKLVQKIENNQPIHAAILNNENKLLLLAEDSIIHIYETTSGKRLFSINESTNWGNSIIHSFDGKRIATISSSSNSADTKINVWDITTGKQLNSFSHDKSLHLELFSNIGLPKLNISSNGRFLSNVMWSFLGPTMTEIFDLEENKNLFQLKGQTNQVVSYFSNESKTVLNSSFDNYLNIPRMWEIGTGKDLKQFKSSEGGINYIATHDETRVVTISRDETLRIWDKATAKELIRINNHGIYDNTIILKENILVTTLDSIAQIRDASTGKLLKKLIGHSDNIQSIKISSDNKLILTSGDNTARIWDVQSGKQLHILEGHKGWVNGAEFSSSNNLVITIGDRTARIWDVITGKELRTLKAKNESINLAIFSKDEKVVLTCSENTAQLWDVASGRELKKLNGHSKLINSASFSPDNKYILTTSHDNTLRIWEIGSGKEVRILDKHTNTLNSAQYSEDGKLILSTSRDHKTILWNVETGKPLYTRLQLENNDWLVYDEDYRFDGTPGAIDYLYLTCGLEVIDLAQVKDSLWVPGLVEKIMNNEEILINDRPAPKLSDLNICDLTPVIEPLDDGDKGLFRYRIIPRNGGLGETEVYINGNLTYKFKPEQLEKKREQNKDIYYLSISSDTLQGFLTGDKGTENPILVKSKVKGSGIYGRGVVLDIEKETDKENPKFFGLFIGVNDYGNPNKEQSELRYRNLDFAAKDANDLSKAVEGTARNLFKQDCYIYNLTGTGTAENIPSKANIQKALKEIGEKAKASDILYIFFAGHGDIPEGSGEKEIRFILHNADKKNLKSTSFGVDELSEWCHPKQIKAQKRVFVFDACHSGQIINQTMAFNGRGDDEATRIRQLDKLKDKNGMMILAAAADNESAYEDETLNQGVLTYHLLDAMKKEKDTSLIIRQWFDEAIEGVKEYSRTNGNKQEPNSFGDGRFEIGNVNEQVRAGIDITCPKTRVGLCEFMSFGEAEVKYPTLKNELTNIFKSTSGRGNFVLSQNIEKAYRVSGVLAMEKNKALIQYEIKKGDQILTTMKLPAFKKKASETEIIETVSKSIQSELERLDKRDEKCKRNN